jgi:hypothetical protein
MGLNGRDQRRGLRRDIRMNMNDEEGDKIRVEQQDVRIETAHQD